MKHRVHDPASLWDGDLVAALLEAQSPVLPPPERARALRERILAGAGAARRPGSVAHLTIRGDEGSWVSLMPRISIKVLREDASTRSYLLRMAPGAKLPAHDHSLEEECMVLEGDVWLGDIHAHAGDYHLARRGLPHGELTTEGGCLLFLRGQKHYPDLGAQHSAGCRAARPRACKRR